MNSTLRNISLASIAAMALSSGWAANDDATFGVSATIASECVVGNTTAMAFGTLAMLNATSGGRSTADSAATATFDATCTNGTASPTLNFSSANGGGSAFALKRAGEDDTIAYTLYAGANDSGTLIAHATDAAFTGFSADGAVKSLTVAGKIAAAAKNGKPVGAYSDTVTITVGFTAD